MIEGMTAFTLGENEFYYPGICHFYVCKDGTVCELAQAYETGLLDDSDVTAVFQRHAEFEDNIDLRRKLLNDMELSVFELHLPDEMKNTIGTALVADGYVQQAVWAQYEKGSVLSDGIRFYGEFAEWMLVFVPQQSGEPMSQWISGAHFTHPTGGELLLYHCSGEYFSNLRSHFEEFGNLFLSNADLACYARRHQEINQALYPELYD